MGKVHKTVRFEEEVLEEIYKLANSQKEKRSFPNMLEILLIEALSIREKSKNKK